MSDLNQKLVEVAQGQFVEQDVLNIVEKIREYDPNLCVQYLDPDVYSSLTDAPYRIMELCPDGNLRLVFSVWQLDERVLEKLYASDTFRHNILAELDKSNAKVKEAEQRRYREEMEEGMDIAKHVLKSPKNSYTFIEKGKKVTVDSHAPSKVELHGD